MRRRPLQAETDAPTGDVAGQHRKRRHRMYQNRSLANQEELERQPAPHGQEDQRPALGVVAPQHPPGMGAQLP
jgi:hypothetical protein